MNQVTVSKTTAPKGQSLWYLARRRLLRQAAGRPDKLVLPAVIHRHIKRHAGIIRRPRRRCRRLFAKRRG